METEVLLDIREIKKSFGKTKAVDNVSLQVHRGEIYSLIGPNGSGKTTLLKMIVGLLRPDAGEVVVGESRVDGDGIETKKLIGYVPDKPEGYQYLSGNEFLALTGRLRQTSNSEIGKVKSKLTKAFAIESVLRERIEGYSRGSLQKLSFIAALIGEPSLLIVDEPVAGLDPKSIEVFGKALKEFTKGGGAVLFVTHTLDFAQDYADRVGVMVNGKLKLEAKAAKTVSSYQKAT